MSPRVERPLLVVLVLVNAVVLLGQIWPAGAPPFARWVNVAFLVGTLLYLGSRFLAARR